MATSMMKWWWEDSIEGATSPAPESNNLILETGDGLSLEDNNNIDLEN